MSKKYDTFAHEIASLKRRAEQANYEDDTSTKASGICCAACGLECAIAPEERTTCQKCYAVHYCSSQCLQWDWSSGGHDETCPKKPPRKRMSFLQFQSSRSLHSTMSGATACYACGLECRVAGDAGRTTCPECKEAHYCSSDCMNWDWEKGGHAQDCQRSQPKKMALTDFHQSLNQKLKQPPPQVLISQELQEQQQQEAAHYISENLEDVHTLADYTIQEETIQDTEYTEETFEGTADDARQSKSGSEESRDDAEEEILIEEYDEEGEIEEETYHDEEEQVEEETFYDEGEADEEQKEEESVMEAELETMQVNRYGSLMAGHGASYRRGTPDSGARAVYRNASGATPDTPETMVTSNQHQQGTHDALQRLQQQLEREQQQQKYRKEISRYYSQPEPEPRRPLPPVAYRKPADQTAQVPSPPPYRNPSPAAPLVPTQSNSDMAMDNPRLQSIHSVLEQYRQSALIGDGQANRRRQRTSPRGMGTDPPAEVCSSQSPPVLRDMQQESSSNPYYMAERGRTPVRELQHPPPSSVYLNENATPSEPPIQQPPSSSAYYNVVPTERASPQQNMLREQQPPQQPSSSVYYNVLPPSERVNSQPPVREMQQLQQQPSSSAIYNVSPSERARPQQSIRGQREQKPSSRAFHSVASSRDLSPRGPLRQESSRRAPAGVSRGNSGLLIVPAAGRAASSNKVVMHDMEVATSAEAKHHQNNSHDGGYSGYEFLSSLTHHSPKCRCGITAVLVAFVVGMLITAAAVGGLLWFKPDLIPGHDDNGTNSEKEGALVVPTVAPTQLPGPISMSLEIELQSPTIGFGTSVALSPYDMVIGSTSGKVVTYHRTPSDGTWSLGQTWSGPVSNSSYGADIDMASDSDGELYLLVGAPKAGNGGTAYLYSYKSSSNTWVELGVSLADIVGSDRRQLRRLGPSDLEKFGSSVAMSGNRRVVIGAPEHNSNGQKSGRVYISHFGKNTATQDLLHAFNYTIEGGVAGGQFGSAVDISDDGSTVGIGAPGEKKFYIFEWNGLEWTVTFQLHYPMDNDLGASVSFLSNNFVAVGAPAADGSKGRVRVCKRDGNRWVETPSVIGENNDSLGSFGTIGGSEASLGPALVVSSANGVVRRYDLSGNQWTKRFEIDENGRGGTVAVSKENGYEVLVGFGGANFVKLYSSHTLSRPSSPTDSSPTTRPDLAPSSVPATKPTVQSPTSGESTSGPQPSPAPTVTQAIPTSQPPSLSQPNPPMGSQPTRGPVTGQQGPTAAPAPNGGVSQPTEAPAASPSGPTPTTSVPTIAPTPEPRWTLVGSPATSTNALSGFGESVAIAEDFVVVSEPLLFSDVGQVQLYQLSPQLNLLNRVVDDNAHLFGSSLDVAVVSGTASLFVGAKETEDKVSGSSFKFGSAAYYEFDASTWAKLGSTMRPEPSLVESGGDFGASVSMARSIRRVAIGAPESSRDTNTIKTGRVYTYEYDGTDWQQMTAQPLFGTAYSKLGSSMDMSADGSRLLLGAPGARSGDGSIFYYEWSDASDTNPSSGWNQILALPGETGEALGTTVAILDDDGNHIAFGGPSHGDLNQGLIRVYTNGGIWFAEGTDIIGAENEYIGKTLCGAMGKVAFGTDTGTFHVYEYVQNTWVEVGAGPDLGSPVVSISMSEDAKTVVVGLLNEEVRVYEL